MWLNKEQTVDSAIRAYRKCLLNASPNHIVIDNLFDSNKLDEVMPILRQAHSWQTQKHTYSALYVGSGEWQNTSDEQRFVKRDVWQGKVLSTQVNNSNIAHAFLSFLRGDEFMSLLSRIFNVPLTDMNVAKPEINTNYFRLSASDFVNLHADDSPGRVLCMLLYLNKEWNCETGGELVFKGKLDEQIAIVPLYNRCVLFDPSSEGAEHWVNAMASEKENVYRYNVTSWYWSE